MFLGYTTIAVLLVSHQTSSLTEDERTSEWIEKNFSQNNRNQFNLDPVTPPGDETDTIVQWVSDVIREGSDKTTSKPSSGFSLDPSNVNIQNTSITPLKPSNKFDDEPNTDPVVEKPCVTEEGYAGVCVLYYLCDPSTRKVIGDGAHLIDIRSGGGECVHYLDICCQLNDRIEPQSEEEVKPPPKQPSQVTINDQQRKVIRNTSASEDAPTSGECGWNKPELFIFQPSNQDIADNGIYANFGDFPWMVALLKKSATTVWVQNDYIGGGSLIHPAVVVTAYHKLLQVTADELKCRAGEWDTQTNREQYPEQERDARKIVAHDQFFRTSAYNDIALIFLKRPFDLSVAPQVGTACLSKSLPPEGTQCFSMGWGKDIKKKTYVNILKKVKLSLVGHSTCQALLRKTRLRDMFVLHPSLTCAGGEEGVDTCRGDGGSSLVCPIGNRGGRTQYAVVGMVVYGISCGKKDVPGVYTNIPHLYQWVDQQMVAEGYGSSTYTY